jgi:hypothetical protein
MYRHFAGLLLTTALLGEDATPGIVRGTLARAEGGTLEILQPGGSTVRCGFDSRTWIERDRKRLQMDALDIGVPVEALTDARAGRCYTRTVRLNPPAATVMPARRVALSTRTSFLDTLYPRGNLTFAGVVIRKSPTIIVLRTRTEPEKLVTLREDTRFMNGGLPASSADIAVNTRVFVRGGKNFENTLEAFQVIWGQIEGPKTITSP